MHQPTPIIHGSLADQAFEKIVQAITTGELQAGERISEVHLARQLGISRGPLREALGRLEGSLVERTPRIGVRVIELSDKCLAELFAVREALEGMACRLAAAKATDRELASMAALLDEHGSNDRILNDGGYFQWANDIDFHTQIVRSSRNDRLGELLIDGLYVQLRLYRFRSSATAGRARLAFAEHRKILKALCARNETAAEVSIRNHIRNGFASLMKANDRQNRSTNQFVALERNDVTKSPRTIPTPPIL